jgi:hypothetical protein
VAERIGLSHVEEALQRLGRGGSKYVRGRIVYVASETHDTADEGGLAADETASQGSNGGFVGGKSREEYIAEMSDIKTMMDRLEVLERRVSDRQLMLAST